MLSKLKNRNVTVEQVRVFICNAEDISNKATNLAKAINDCRVDEIPDATESAKHLVSASRNLLDAALALMFLGKMQDIKRQLTEKLTKQLRDQE
jgi:hypothetical protein